MAIVLRWSIVSSSSSCSSVTFFMTTSPSLPKALFFILPTFTSLVRPGSTSVLFVAISMASQYAGKICGFFLG
ncbi:hypothetical protein IX57_07250 [Paracoccus sanguinis]|nr:hypothetical protein IX57_07250 [Paracoccus sanguinis]